MPPAVAGYYAVLAVLLFHFEAYQIEKNIGQHTTGLQVRLCNKKNLNISQNKTYVVGSQKNGHNEPVILSA